MSAGINRTMSAGPNRTMSAGPNRTMSAGPNRTVSARPNRTMSVGTNRTMSAGTDSPALAASAESLSLENLRLSDRDEVVTRERVDSETSGRDLRADSRAPSSTSYQPRQQASVWCSPRTVRRQPEVRLLLHELARARKRGECRDYDTPARAVTKVRPFSAMKLSSAGSSSLGENTYEQTRPATSLGQSSASFSVPSTMYSASSIGSSCFDDSEQSSVTESMAKRVTFTQRDRPKNRSSSGFCKRALSSTLIRGGQWNNKHRQTTFDPVLQKVTVHITNFRNPAEEVTLSMCYSSCVTSHNSRVVTDDIQRLSGRKEHMTRQKAYKIEERLAIQRKRRHNLANARIKEMQRAARRKNQEHRESDLDARKTRSPRLSTPGLLVCERVSARQDRIRTRSYNMQAFGCRDTYISLNKDC